MQNTTNYGLKKPEPTDFYNIQDQNDNADIIDAELKKINDGKVDKVNGKGLSTNDYTTAEKNKLAGIAAGATKTIVNNTLTSASTTDALSAAQGKVLKDLVDSKASNTDLTQLRDDFTAHMAEKASLTKTGHVQLSNDTASTDETKAATPKAVKTAIDNIQIGGQNLLSISAVSNEWTYSADAIYSNKARNAGSTIFNKTLPKGNYVLSFMLLEAVTSDTSFSFYENGVDIATNSFTQIQNYEVGKVYSKVMNFTADTAVIIKMWGNTANQLFKFKMQIEKGNKPTDFTLALEDIKGEITKQVGSVQIGGRNVLLNSKGESTDFWENASVGEIGGYKALLNKRTSATAGASRNLVIQSSRNNSLLYRMGKGEYALSGYIYIDSSVPLSTAGANEILVRVYHSASSNDYTNIININLTNLPKDQWLYIEAIGLLLGDAVDVGYLGTGVYVALQQNGAVYFRNFKLEKGNKATDWTPAPEDIEEKLKNKFDKTGGIITGDTTVEKGIPAFVWKVPGRTNDTRVFWNASSTSDFGMVTRVDGTDVFTATSDKRLRDGNLKPVYTGTNVTVSNAAPSGTLGDDLIHMVY